ncbi:ArnT family glycosyltransferase [Methylobrevis pamukkalensis]|uniref:Glycosyltransferase RgtA/B/C/D-like domain-containing protein n=1 Tax=Methylobrevis pamukkalensis TaxID=1439726 RepID=A0A1E3H093_9HYPH|nr:glycosyltransferase family 39 protein [Methylobrevis pamukkalensis]ODN69704.1 hypothetical protein A6302_02998 [Methylobrevis pamukkalensis]
MTLLARGERGDPAVLLAVVGAVTALRVAALMAAQTDLFFDEAQYWSWAQDPAFGYYSKPPLIAWLIAATTAVFGDAEWAVRLSAPLLHGVTALVLGRLGGRLYGARAGFWSTIGYLLVPAVSFSSLLITTDVPLLLAWALALLALHRWLDGGGWGPAVALGVAVGVGLNAKYAMALFPALTVLFLGATPGLRQRLASPQLLAALGIALLLILPNLAWNAAHGFVTFSHTRDNASWSGPTLQIGSLLDFLGAQFGVLGPVMFAGLLAAAAGLWRSDRRAADRFLLAFSLPVLGVFMIQALLSRANANWGATAYPAAVVLVTALLLDPRRRALFRLSNWLHAAVALVLVVAPALARDLRLPGLGNPMERVTGWSAAMTDLGALAAGRGATTLIFVRRADIAEALYYLRGSGLGFAVLPPQDGAGPKDHYELTRAFSPARVGPGLLVLPGEAAVPPADLAALGLRLAGEPLRLAVPRGVARSRVLTVLPVAW